MHCITWSKCLQNQSKNINFSDTTPQGKTFSWPKDCYKITSTAQSSLDQRLSRATIQCLRACLLGALAKLPGPGSELRRPILVAWGQDRCLGGVLPGRAASKQALSFCDIIYYCCCIGGENLYKVRWSWSDFSIVFPFSLSCAGANCSCLHQQNLFDLWGRFIFFLKKQRVFSNPS